MLSIIVLFVADMLDCDQFVANTADRLMKSRDPQSATYRAAKYYAGKDKVVLHCHECGRPRFIEADHMYCDITQQLRLHLTRSAIIDVTEAGVPTTTIRSDGLCWRCQGHKAVVDGFCVDCAELEPVCTVCYDRGCPECQEVDDDAATEVTATAAGVS